MSWIRGLFLSALIGLFLLLAYGYLSFADGVQRMRPSTPVARADGIVALTGGSAERLRSAMQLLEDGRAQRLLVTGVNPKVSDKDVFALLGGDSELQQCCVDLGRQAEDTLGNASEASEWASKHDFSHLIVVTDDFHMARSLAELRIAMPDVELTPYPVQTPMSEPGAWKKDPKVAGRLASEYLKYVVIQLREAVLRPPRRDESKAAA